MTEEFLDIKRRSTLLNIHAIKIKNIDSKESIKKNPIYFAEFELYSPFPSNRLRQLEVHQTMSYIINDALVHGTHD